MNVNFIKRYYVIILNILTGILVSISPAIAETSLSGTNFVFGIVLIALPILTLYDKKNIRTYLQILSIMNGFIAITGLILLVSGFVDILVPFFIIGLFAPATFFSYEMLKR